MNEVTVRFYATLKDKVGQSPVVVGAGSVAEVLEGLKARFGRAFSDALFPAGEFNDRYIILLRGKRIFRAEQDTIILSSGDVLDVFPPVAGG